MRLPRIRKPFWVPVIATIVCALSTVAVAQDDDAGSTRGMQNLLAQGESTSDDSEALIDAGFSAVTSPASAGGLNIAFLQAEDELPACFTLESAVDWALEHNREIHRLRFEIDAADAVERQSRLLYTPTLDLGLRSMSSGPASSIEIPIPGTQPIEIEMSTTDITSTASVTLTQPVYMFGTFSLARHGASLGLEQSRLRLSRAEQTVRRDVEEAFLQASLTKALVEVARGAVETAEERLRISQVRYDAGDVARFEILRSEVSVATAREELLQAETAAELAMGALVQKLGLPSGTPIEIEPPGVETIEPTAPDFTLEEAQQIALVHRADLDALELAVDLAEVGILSERNRPSLVLHGSYSRSDRAMGFYDKDNWSVILNLSYRLFDSGRAQASMDEATARRDALLVQLEEARTLVELEVESAYRSLGESLERIDVARATLESAREALRIAELGYTEGVIRYIDYQDADLGYSRAETLHLQAVYGYLIAQSRLLAAMGVSEFEQNPPLIPQGPIRW